MNKIEELFQPLIDAFDIFLNKEEKKFGCLEDEEDARFLADRNYYSELAVKKSNADKKQLTKENRLQIQPIILDIFGDDVEGMDNCIRKPQKSEVEY